MYIPLSNLAGTFLTHIPLSNLHPVQDVFTSYILPQDVSLSRGKMYIARLSGRL